MKLSLLFSVFVPSVSASFISTSVKRNTKAKVTKKHAKNNVVGVEVVPQPVQILNPMKEKDDLQADIDKARNFKALLEDAFMFDADAANLCIAKSDDHQTCLYDIHTQGLTEYTCQCRTTSAAQAFQEVDMDNDDVVTWDEIREYNNGVPCVFPFTYTTIEGVTITSNSCITDDDVNDFEWCSTRTYANGDHSKGFFRYCNTDEFRLAWMDALVRLDTNENGELSFHEVVTHARRRRMARRMRKRRKLQQGMNDGLEDCDDCDIPDDCRNPIVKAIDGECRNNIKTEPFGDEEGDEDLLRMLATVMVDVYSTTYPLIQQPIERDGMDNWLTRTKDHIYGSGEDDGSMAALVQALACIAVLGDDVPEQVNTFGSASLIPNVVRNNLLYQTVQLAFTENEDDDTPDDSWIVEQCRNVVENNEFLDGRNAIQWSIYTINQGPHQGKKVLGIMGTLFTNFEQNFADAFVDLMSTPVGNTIIETMAEELVVVAESENVDFVTGHSLGGILAEMVCSLTGIKGASFAALGAFDPFSRVDRFLLEGEILIQLATQRANLQASGYDEAEIDEIISQEDIRENLITQEYNGVIHSTMHDGVKFQVVVNVYDLAIRAVASFDSNQCSHIARSCDIRWLWFGGEGFWSSAASMAGHSSIMYGLYTNAYYTTGYQESSEATIDYSKLFLPGTEKNLACESCRNDSYCESGSCDVVRTICYGEGARYPTFCPRSGNQAVCSLSSECMSGRCETPVSTAISLYFVGYDAGHFCYDKLAEGEYCNEHSDCQSSYCTWAFTCGSIPN